MSIVTEEIHVLHSSQQKQLNYGSDEIFPRMQQYLHAWQHVELYFDDVKYDGHLQ